MKNIQRIFYFNYIILSVCASGINVCWIIPWGDRHHSLSEAPSSMNIHVMKRDKYWEKKIPLIQSWESISTCQNMEMKEENGYAVW